ncbi:arginyl-tRNA synthetase [Arthrobacter sp. V4I6]|uniref:arginine--tRNA ligase n=1 Tax=unclassified Arthrobacter TaxID=235627 RepID=UPI00277E5590|nr:MULTISPECIES: arginine--tRNA ligase [unclassified Arthrobacter]MDQ0819808.1 arginyl-tRNA synthetase [Arthrobacter sp. V1I7]MDQ0853987.1 arginyl-tRNA synthetase [Arthrobacter sp. V4I6]
MVVPRVQAAIASAFGEEYRGTDPVVRPSQFADIQVNAAMALAKKVGLPPREAAARIVDALDLDGICSAVEISGPGFINLTFDGTWIEELLNDEATTAAGAAAPAGPVREPRRVVVDYSSPNVAKEMHVGHLRTTVVGDSLVKVLEALGDTVIRQNHIGDWGTPFGMLIEHWLEVGEDSPEAALLVDDPSAFYQAARAKFDASAAEADGFATRARLRVVALQSGDAATFAVWQRLVAQSKRYFNAIYAKLGISLTDDHIAGESSYDADLAQLCQELEDLGLARVSDGALCTFPAGFTGRDGQPLPLIIRKSDGGYGYGTTDLATIRYRVRDLQADRVLYVVGAPQNVHLRMVLATARDAGWLPETVEAVHVQIGNVLGEDGKILKSRSGAPVKLMALLEEAVDRARAVIDASRPELTEEERAVTARQVGIGAVKYADLSVGHDTEYVFDFDRMLALSGNTGPYVQYAAARIRSILRKAGVLERHLAAGTAAAGTAAAGTAGTAGTAAAVAAGAGTAGMNVDGGTPATAIAVVEPAERALALHLLEFGVTLSRVGELLEPHRLSTYLFELAQLFTAFYDQCPVLKAEESVRDSRLALCALVLRRLSGGLELLGIETPENM